MNQNFTIDIIQAVKEVALVVISAAITLCTALIINSKQQKKEKINKIENEEEQIILEAVKFISVHQDKLRSLITSGNYEKFYEFIDSDYFPSLFLISFQLKRIERPEIWKKFEVLYNSIFVFTDLVHKIKVVSTDLYDKEEFKVISKLQREFFDLCINYLKLKK